MQGDGQGSALRNLLRRATLAPALGGGLLAGITLTTAFAGDNLQWKRPELPQVIAAPNEFTPAADAYPIWLPKRPTGSVTISDDDAKPAESPVQANSVSTNTVPTSTVPRNALQSTPRRSEREPLIEPVPAGAEVEESPTPAVRVAGHWQSGLKWRLRHPSEFAASKEMNGTTLRQGSSYSDSAKSAGTQMASTTTANEAIFIRKVSDAQETNPFKDPFGDGQKPSLAPPPAGDRGQINSNPAPAPAPSNNQFNSPTVPVQAPAPRLPLGEPAAEDAPPFQRIPSSNYLRQPGMASDPDRPKEKCNRVYNDRDCCDEDAKRTLVRTRLKELTLNKISLDITPSFKPDTLGRPDYEAKKRESLETVPAKTWKNRSGESLGSGRLVDFENSRIVIVQDDGEKKRISYQELSDDDLCFVSAWWGLPSEFALGDDPYEPRNWSRLTMTWKATSACHRPLYFEETQLERYGHTTGPISQTFVSGAHFFLNIAALPYKMSINPPNECQYPLGYYRPGSCAPWLLPPVPISLKGALIEAGIVVGGVAALPF